MSEKTKPELILEAARVFLWPLIIVLAVLWFKSDVTDMMKNRSFKIGLVEVGDRINSLGGSVQGELIRQTDYLNTILNNADDPAIVRTTTNEALSTIRNAQEGINKDIRNISKVVPEIVPSVPEQKQLASTRQSTAKDWESIGFDHINKRDIESAITTFTEAEKLWPDYHNVSEIRRLLVRKRQDLKDSNIENWREVYKTILSDLSWGMPATARREMQRQLKAP
jgi:hypothetical protein